DERLPQPVSPRVINMKPASTLCVRIGLSPRARWTARGVIRSTSHPARRFPRRALSRKPGQSGVRPAPTGYPRGVDAPPVLVVSLPNARERRRSIAAQLGALGVPFAFVDGVDARIGRLDAAVDRAAVRARLGRDLLDGEIGCALAHHRVYERMIRAGMPGAL